MQKLFKPGILRSFVFGVEDSLVSTVGLVSGIAIVGSSRPAILITGITLIFVEAFSMAVGELVSDNAVREVRTGSETSLLLSLKQSLVMFFSYIFSGFVVLVPYLFLQPLSALPLSISISIVCLFSLGAFGAHLARISILKNGFTMTIIGGAAILIGMGAGTLVESLTGAGLL